MWPVAIEVDSDGFSVDNGTKNPVEGMDWNGFNMDNGFKMDNNKKFVEEDSLEMPGDTKQWLSKLLEAPIMQATNYSRNNLPFLFLRKSFSWKFAHKKSILPLSAAHHLDPWASLLQETNPRWGGCQWKWVRWWQGCCNREEEVDIWKPLRSSKSSSNCKYWMSRSVMLVFTYFSDCLS